MMELKQKVYEAGKQVVNERIIALQGILSDLIESTKNETRSSAGDKYETGRAMLQIEQDNVRKQLKEALSQKALFEQIDITKNLAKITRGSLVKTDKGYFFISLALGKISIEDLQVMALSPQSPLGSKLMNIEAAGRVTVNGTTYTIERIY
jgi:hypothetical protein